MKRDTLIKFANVVVNGTKSEILTEFDFLAMHPDFQSKGWASNFAKLAKLFTENAPQFTIIKTDGNSKLPFYAFSTIPGSTCPGAGDCLKFCYSFKAWRFPAAFCRQIQNAYLMRFNTLAIVEAFSAIPDDSDFRLYVDGDFSSSHDVEFWFDLLKTRPSIKAYGYSKSFAEILSYWGKYPSNYALNISSGHNSTADIVERVKALPITRGEFRAVSVGFKVKSSDHGSPKVNQALRLLTQEKIFACPGKCGSCTGKGHACGMLSQLKGKVIAIAVH
jgi:hypothetical protein